MLPDELRTGVSIIDVHRLSQAHVFMWEIKTSPEQPQGRAVVKRQADSLNAQWGVDSPWASVVRV